MDTPPAPADTAEEAGEQCDLVPSATSRTALAAAAASSCSGVPASAASAVPRSSSAGSKRGKMIKRQPRKRRPRQLINQDESVLIRCWGENWGKPMPIAKGSAAADDYLEQISAYLRSDTRSGSFRTLLDTWFAYDQGGPLWRTRNGNGNARWFNKPRLVFPQRRKAAWHVCDSIYAMHFVSADVHDLIERKRSGEPFEPPRDWIVKDHCIPIAELKMYLARRAGDMDDLQSALRQYYRIGAITKQEDRKLETARLRQRMPTTNWQDGSPYARYDLAEIGHHTRRE